MAHKSDLLNLQKMLKTKKWFTKCILHQRSVTNLHLVKTDILFSDKFVEKSNGSLNLKKSKWMVAVFFLGCCFLAKNTAQRMSRHVWLLTRRFSGGHNISIYRCSLASQTLDIFNCCCPTSSATTTHKDFSGIQIIRDDLWREYHTDILVNNQHSHSLTLGLMWNFLAWPGKYCIIVNCSAQSDATTRGSGHWPTSARAPPYE